MLNNIDRQLEHVQGMRLRVRNDRQLLSTEAMLLLAKAVQHLNRNLQVATAASDHIRGGYALRVVSADRERARDLRANRQRAS